MFILRRTGTDLTATFGMLPARTRAAVGAKLAELTDELRRRVYSKLSGPVLVARTGRLRSQVTQDVDLSGDRMVGRVYMAGDTTVAAVHEYGGRSAYVIEAVNARALHFVTGDREVFARRVNHPPLPERSYLRSSLDDMTPVVAAGFREALVEAMRA